MESYWNWKKIHLPSNKKHKSALWDGCAKPPLGKSKEAQIYLPMGELPRERI